ncbi:MAG: hypothetical protein FIA95_15905 [Gemmatimonadetes bacterium]|nr:hypothetical protein [Gemmatimonadota bacterium]
MARARTLAEAWSGWLESGRGVPRGLLAFLRSASVEEDATGVEIYPPPGPALDRLAEPAVLEQIRAALSARLGRQVEVRVATSGGTGLPGPRIGREDVRADTLRALYRKEPRLEKAVEELDLELME